MPIQVLKKCCERCGKAFFTYENDKNFCNSNCEAKFKYAQHFNIDEKLIEHDSVCAFCHEEIHTKGRNKSKFCNKKCERGFLNQQSRQKTIDKSLKETDKQKKKSISYDELNRRAEWKRVNDDESWMYKRNRERI